MNTTDPHFIDLPTLLQPVAGQLDRVREQIKSALADATNPVGDFLSQLDLGGAKMLRPALTLLSGQCIGPLQAEHIKLGAIVEMIHLASLLHDDVIDQAQTRRGQASANTLWGNTQAVLLGDFVLSKAFAMGTALNLSDAPGILCQTAEEICTGEIHQNLRKGDLNLSENDYLAIIEAKTASLFGACCCLGAMAAHAQPQTCQRLRRYGVALGVMFQITDDLLDILGNADREGKTLGTDVFSGKLTLPIIYWLGQEQRDRRQGDFKRYAQSADTTELCTRIVQSGAVDYALNRGQAYAQNALDNLSDLPDSPSKDALAGLVSFVLNRVYTR